MYVKWHEPPSTTIEKKKQRYPFEGGKLSYQQRLSLVERDVLLEYVVVTTDDSFDTILRRTTDYVTVLSYTAFNFMLFIYAISLEHTDVARSQTIYDGYEDMQMVG